MAGTFGFCNPLIIHPVLVTITYFRKNNDIWLKIWHLLEMDLKEGCSKFPMLEKTDSGNFVGG
jgi:hypothetical protein